MSPLTPVKRQLLYPVCHRYVSGVHQLEPCRILQPHVSYRYPYSSRPGTSPCQRAAARAAPSGCRSAGAVWASCFSPGSPLCTGWPSVRRPPHIWPPPGGRHTRMCRCPPPQKPPARALPVSPATAAIPTSRYRGGGAALKFVGRSRTMDVAKNPVSHPRQGPGRQGVAVTDAPSAHRAARRGRRGQHRRPVHVYQGGPGAGSFSHGYTATPNVIKVPYPTEPVLSLRYGSASNFGVRPLRNTCVRLSWGVGHGTGSAEARTCHNMAACMHDTKQKGY